MTINKNLSGIDVLKDKTNLMTRVRPRGSGAPPSEVALDTPQYWPAAQILEVDHVSASSVFFRLPNQYSSYAGFTKDGDPLPSGYYVGRNEVMAYNQAYAPISTTVFGQSISAPSMAVAQLFHMGGNWRPYAVSLWLQRMLTPPGTQWTVQPRFRVGLYSVTGGKDLKLSGGVVQSAGYGVPYQGPLVWCYGNLLSISTAGGWYTFPMQTNAYGEGWYAWVIEPYPTTNTQWGTVGRVSPDYMFVGGSPALTSASTTCAEYSASGVTPNGWQMGFAAGSNPVINPYLWQLAFQLWVVDHDVTSQFTQSNDNYPGRYVACPAADFVGDEDYVFHYMHSPYLINWDAEDQYGKYEGTWKNDTITTQAALMTAGAQYLTAVSEPTMTISLSAVDLYNIDPVKNWGEELYVGGSVRVIDDLMGLDELCIITEIARQDLTQPHKIDTLTLNNIHANAQKLLAQVAAREKKNQAYMTGITVDTPYTASGAASTSSPATMLFNVRAQTQLVHEIRMTVAPQDQTSAFTVTVDGAPVGGSSPRIYNGFADLDIMTYCTPAHNGQVTPGVHTVVVTPQ